MAAVAAVAAVAAAVEAAVVDGRLAVVVGTWVGGDEPALDSRVEVSCSIVGHMIRRVARDSRI